MFMDVGRVPCENWTGTWTRRDELLGFFVMILGASASLVAPSFAADETAETSLIAPVQPVENLDARINSLQSTKDCIHEAKTKSEIERCRRSIQIKRERIKTH